MAKSRSLLGSIAVIIALAASSQGAANYSFAVFWTRAGVAADLSGLYKDLFESKLRSSCPAAAHAALTFEEFPLPKWPPWSCWSP
uniref:Uncharacterized protein n=1 Tax=Macrostomum lignano TaxID=282301 RepID=A0A1I8GWI5_9PLAT